MKGKKMTITISNGTIAKSFFVPEKGSHKFGVSFEEIVDGIDSWEMAFDSSSEYFSWLAQYEKSGTNENVKIA